MAFYRKSGGSNVTPSIVRRRSGSGWVDVQTIRRRSGSSWVTVWTAYTPITTVTISGATVINWPNLTFSLTASSDGSAASKTYTWTKQSGSSFLSIVGSSSNAAVTIQSSRSNSSFTSDTAVFRCTVSDGTSSAFKDVTVISNGTL